MKLKLKKSWNRCHGMTLIEVIAGMALLGTLLVSVVMATSRLIAQSNLATSRVEAYQVADEFLAGWWDDLPNIPRNGTGLVSGHDNWRWRTVSADAEINSPGGNDWFGQNENKSINADLVTLEIVKVGDEIALLAHVEILVEIIKNEKNADSTSRPDSN